MNKVVLMGRLTKNPEIRYAEGENPVAVGRYTLAVNRRWKKEGETEADFIPCIVFGKSATFAEKYFSKGQMVGSLDDCRCGTGRIRTETKEEIWKWLWRNSTLQAVKTRIRSLGESQHRMGFIP